MVFWFFCRSVNYHSLFVSLVIFGNYCKPLACIGDFQSARIFKNTRCRSVDVVHLRLSNRKITTARTTIAVRYECPVSNQIRDTFLDVPQNFYDYVVCVYYENKKCWKSLHYDHTTEIRKRR